MRYRLRALIGTRGSTGAGHHRGADGGASAASGTSGLTPPEAHAAIPSSVGKGEGKLNLIAWEGYAQPEWVKPFEKSTGCQVNVKYAGTSSEMVSLMANGGGDQYDLVSASGDADLRLIYGGDVQADQHQADPVLEAVQAVPAVAGVQHDRRQALRRLLRVRPQRAAVLDQDIQDGADLVVGHLLEEVRGPDHDPGQPDPDRRRGAVPGSRRARA